MSDAVLLFDEECGFCKVNVERTVKMLHSPVPACHYKNFDFDGLSVGKEEASSFLVFVDEEKNCYFGSEAFAKWLQTGGFFWKTLGGTMELPGVSFAAKGIYSLVRKFKHKV